MGSLIRKTERVHAKKMYKLFKTNWKAFKELQVKQAEEIEDDHKKSKALWNLHKMRLPTFNEWNKAVKSQKAYDAPAEDVQEYLDLDWED